MQLIWNWSLSQMEQENWKSDYPWLWGLSLHAGLNPAGHVVLLNSLALTMPMLWSRGLFCFSVISPTTFISPEQPWRRSVISLAFFKKDCYLKDIRRQSVSDYSNHLLQETWHVPIRHPLGTWPLLSAHLLEWTTGLRGCLMNTNLLAK